MTLCKYLPTVGRPVATSALDELLIHTVVNTADAAACESEIAYS